MTSFTIFTLFISYIVKIFPIDPNSLRLLATVIIGLLCLLFVTTFVATRFQVIFADLQIALPMLTTVVLAVPRIVYAVLIGIDGLICSPEEAANLRSIVGSDMLLVTPGVRPAGAPARALVRRRWSGRRRHRESAR